MEKNVGNLEAENRELKARQAELTSKFCDEREMVKYLHSVIKNYESLLRHETGSARSRTRSGGHVRNCPESVMEISCKGENLLRVNESSFLKACVRPQKDDMLPFDEQQSKRASEFQHRLKAHETAMSMAMPRSLIYSSTDEVSSSEGEMLNASGLESDLDSSFELSDDFRQIVSKEEEELGDVTISPALTRQTYRVTQSKQVDFDSSSSSRKQTLKEMRELVDALLQKANKYEKRVRRKDSEMKRLEIKFDYLESIAFGEESECL